MSRRSQEKSDLRSYFHWLAGRPKGSREQPWSAAAEDFQHRREQRRDKCVHSICRHCYAGKRYEHAVGCEIIQNSCGKLWNKNEQCDSIKDKQIVSEFHLE